MHIISHPPAGQVHTGKYKCKQCRLTSNKLKEGKCPYCGGATKAAAKEECDE